MRPEIKLRLLWMALAAALLVASAHPLCAAERITLTSGYTVRCDHHAQASGKVRLYLTAGEDNYIEFASDRIATVEQIPDPPQPSAVTPQAPAQNQTSNQKLSAVDLTEILSRAGKDHNLDVDLLASIVKAESGGNSRAVSSAGARGLMQLMPSTAAGLGVANSFQPAQNVEGGSAYLDALLTHYHDNLALALAAYNAGPATVERYRGIPPYRETRAYVARVIHEFNRCVLYREALTRQACRNAGPLPQKALP